MRKAKLGESWYNVINYALDTIHTQQVGTFVAGERRTKRIYPAPDDVFKAYKLTPYEDVKVVILGQDPYHSGIADGLAFSCSSNVQTPPSLQKIKDIIREENPDANDQTFIENDLKSWAKQGVFLLNTVLTVEQGKPNSHKGRGWEYLIQQTLFNLSKKENVVFLLWGKEAAAFNRFITNPNHKIVVAEHPAAASYGNRAWMHQDCFNQANEYLTSMGLDPIDWNSVVIF